MFSRLLTRLASLDRRIPIICSIIIMIIAALVVLLPEDPTMLNEVETIVIYGNVEKKERDASGNITITISPYSSKVMLKDRETTLNTPQYMKVDYEGDVLFEDLQTTTHIKVTHKLNTETFEMMEVSNVETISSESLDKIKHFAYIER